MLPDDRPDTRPAVPDLYAAYASQHVDGASRGRPWFPVLDHIGVHAPLRLLDLGCGDGALLREAQRRGLGEVSGVDHSPEQVERAHRAGTTTVVQADAIAHLAANPGQWDVIVTVDLLEHLEHDDVLRLAQAIAAALRPGGEWVAQVPNGVSPFVGNHAYGDFTHRTIYTDRSMRQIARAVGLERAVDHARSRCVAAEVRVSSAESESSEASARASGATAKLDSAIRAAESAEVSAREALRAADEAKEACAS
jgi:SAM-dependent methyltransferase